MTLNVAMVTEQPHQPKITVVGVGGGGGNAVKNMIEAQLQGVNFVVANTDLQALEQSTAEKTIRIGMNITEGLGAGANPEVGAAAAEESFDDIAEAIRGSHMVFITAGMGGGTGTGGAPVVARIAKEQGILTVAVVTKPFGFEGSRRMKLAESGIEELQQYADTVIIIPNQNLFRIATERTTLMEAFKMADDVLYKGVRGVTDLMINPGLINLDFNDIKTVMSEMGQAMMGTGQAEGERRAIMAAEMAISSPLLDGISMTGARGVLINITGGMDMTLYEVDEAANRIREEVDPDANIIYGQVIDTEMEGQVRVSVVATGIGASKPRQSQGFDISNAGFGGSSSNSSSSYGSSFSSPAASSASSASAAMPKPAAPVSSPEPKHTTSSVVSENSIEAKLSSAPQATETPKTSNVSEPKQTQEVEQEADFDDLEIPAFLRRQAN